MYCIYSIFKAWYLPLGLVLCAFAATAVQAQILVGGRRSVADPFPQPIANPFEGRIQVFASPDAKAMRFDIGASPALVSADSTLRIRADFFTLSKMRSESAMKFPVETIDYWFGLSWAWAPPELPTTFRLRLAHVSAHIVDGMRWPLPTETMVPIYSREFAELLTAIRYRDVRLYGGLTYVWSSHHPEFTPWIPQVGVEYTREITEQLRLSAAYDGKLVGYRSVALPQHCLQVGVVYRHRTSVEGGLILYRYDGRSIHGMLASTQDHYWAIGVRLGMP